MCVCWSFVRMCKRDDTKLASHTRHHPWQNKPGLLYQKASSSLVLFSKLFDHPLQLDFDLQTAFWRTLSCARYRCIYFMFLFIMCPKQHCLHEVLSTFLIFSISTQVKENKNVTNDSNMSKSNWKNYKHIHKQSSLTAFPPKGWGFSWAGWKLYRIVTHTYFSQNCRLQENLAKTANFKKIWSAFLKHCSKYLIWYLERSLNGSKLHKATFTAWNFVLLKYELERRNLENLLALLNEAE